MDKIILYTTHCPKCAILEKKLTDKNIKFEIVDDLDIMIEKEFLTAPMLEVNEEVLDFGSAIKWVNNK